MKRMFMLTMILIALAASSVLAEPIDDKWMLTPRVGYAWMSSKDGTGTFNGYAASLSIERNVYGQSYALGLQAGYGLATEEVVPDEGEPFDIDHTSIPVLLTFKYMFGNKRWTGHLGFGAGIHYSTTKAPDVTYKEESITGFAMAVPLGLMFWVTENVNIDVSYQFNWLLSSYLADDASHSVNLGVGFQF